MPGWADALKVMEMRAKASRSAAEERLAAILGAAARPVSTLSGAFWQAGRLTVNFHPDRRTLLGVTVDEGLCRHGRYYSQFVTGTSSGGRSAVPGGERDRWEDGLFGGEYRGAAPEDRPVYGSLDLFHDPHGGSPRFGSSFLVLKDHVRRRTSLCVGDSHAGPRDIGTFTDPLALLAGLFEQAADGAVLERAADVHGLLALLHAPSVAPMAPSRVLDSYIEAHVHGGLDLLADAEAVIVDRSFRGTVTEEQLVRASERYELRLGWHGGSEMEAAAIPVAFRRPETPAVAARLARADGIIDAAAIGRAAAMVDPSPPTPTGDPVDSALQQLKYVWHAVAALGHDARSGATGGSTFQSHDDAGRPGAGG